MSSPNDIGADLEAIFFIASKYINIVLKYLSRWWPKSFSIGCSPYWSHP